MLLTFSGNRDFSMGLNEQYNLSVQFDLKDFEGGTYADLTYQVIQRMIKAGPSTLKPLYKSLVSVISNTAPYVKSLSKESAEGIFSLIKTFSDAELLKKREENSRILSNLFEAVNYVLLYHDEGNEEFLVALIKYREILKIDEIKLSEDQPPSEEPPAEEPASSTQAASIRESNVSSASTESTQVAKDESEKQEETTTSETNQTEANEQSTQDETKEDIDPKEDVDPKEGDKPKEDDKSKEDDPKIDEDSKEEVKKEEDKQDDENNMVDVPLDEIKHEQYDEDNKQAKADSKEGNKFLSPKWEEDWK